MRSSVVAAFLFLGCVHPKPVEKEPQTLPVSEAPVVEIKDLPAFTLKTTAQQPMSADSLAGKVVLINFWASYCGPCKAEFPALETLYKTYESEGLLVLGVSIDDTAEEAGATAAQFGLSFPNLYGGESLYRQLGGKGTPFSVLFERDHIAAKISGRRTADFFEGLVWSALSLEPKSRIGAIQPKENQAKPVAVAAPPKVVAPPKPLAKEANGWKLESVPTYSGNFGALYGVKRGDKSRAFVGGVNGDIFVSDGDGVWRSVAHDDDSQMIEGFWAASANDLYAVGNNSPILSSVDGGSTWSASGPRYDLEAVWGSSPNDVYAVGSKGLILHSANKGKTWEKLESNVTLSLFSIWGSGPDDIYIGAAFGILLHSTDKGKTWQKIDTNIRMMTQSIWGSGPDDIYAVGGGTKSTILHSTDRGKTWASQEKGDNYLGSVVGLSGEVWVSGNGELYRSVDKGKTWEKIPVIPDAPVLFLWGTEGEIFTAGPRNTIMHMKR